MKLCIILLVSEVNFFFILISFFSRTYLTRPEILEQFLNPMYDPNPLVIWPSVAPQSLVRERERERDSP